MKYINKECKTVDEDIICYQCGYIILKYDLIFIHTISG